MKDKYGSIKKLNDILNDVELPTANRYMLNSHGKVEKLTDNLGNPYKAKDWQITGHYPFGITYMGLKKGIKHIPVEIWEEVKSGQIIPYIGHLVPTYLHTDSGKLYQVTKQSNK